MKTTFIEKSNLQEVVNSIYQSGTINDREKNVLEAVINSVTSFEFITCGSCKHSKMQGGTDVELVELSCRGGSRSCSSDSVFGGYGRR